MRSLTILLALAALLLLAGVSLAQSGGPYDLTWTTVDGGGEITSHGGDFSLGGTIGQPDAGRLHGGPYALTGGFWPGATAARICHVYLPLVIRMHTP